MQRSPLLLPTRLGTCLGVVASSLFLGAGLSPAKAILPGIDNLSGGTIDSNGSWTLGYEFNLSKTSVIDALGSYDQNGDGLNGRYDIGLWDTSGNLLSTASVSGSGDPLVSSFRWADIADITLGPGNYIVASAGAWSTNGDNYFYSGSYTTNVLTYVIDKYIVGSNLQFPISSGGGVAPGWLGGNVSFETTPVPAPLPFLGAGAAFCFSRKLRQRVKSASLR